MVWQGKLCGTIEYGDCATIGKLSITRESHISEIDFEQKMALLWRFFGLRTHQKGLSVAHSPYDNYIICSTVGRSIASVSNLGEHIYLSACVCVCACVCTKVNMTPQLCISAMDLPTVLYILHIVICTLHLRRLSSKTFLAARSRWMYPFRAR